MGHGVINRNRLNRRKLIKIVSVMLVFPFLSLKPALASTDLFDGPIKLIAPFSPGGPVDTMARVVADKLSQILGVSVYVENKPGAGGMLGMDMVAKSEPNARTIILSPMGIMTVMPFIYSKLPYDPVNDFQSVALLSHSSNILIVPNDSPYKTLKDLVDDAKGNPAKLIMGSAGNATSTHLTGVLFNEAAGINTLHVPYKGSAQALNDLVGGRLDYSFEVTSTALPFIESGKVRPIAMAGKARNRAFPDVPTIAESGYPGFSVEFWGGIYTKSGSPRDRVEALNRALNVALRETSLKNYIEDSGASVLGGSIEDADALFKREFARWPPVLKAANVKAD